MDYLFPIWAIGSVLSAYGCYHEFPTNLPPLGKLLHGVVGALVALAWPLVLLVSIAWCFCIVGRKDTKHEM